MYVRTDLQLVAGIGWYNITAAWCPAARQLPHNASLAMIIHKGRSTCARIHDFESAQNTSTDKIVMSKFNTLIKFTVEGSNKPFFAKSDPQTKVAAGSTVTAFQSFADLESGQRSEQVKIKKVNFIRHKSF
jgi:hypothetical protein